MSVSKIRNVLLAAALLPLAAGAAPLAVDAGRPGVRMDVPAAKPARLASDSIYRWRLNHRKPPVVVAA